MAQHSWPSSQRSNAVATRSTSWVGTSALSALPPANVAAAYRAAMRTSSAGRGGAGRAGAGERPFGVGVMPQPLGAASAGGHAAGGQAGVRADARGSSPPGRPRRCRRRSGADGTAPRACAAWACGRCRRAARIASRRSRAGARSGWVCGLATSALPPVQPHRGCPAVAGNSGDRQWRPTGHDVAELQGVPMSLNRTGGRTGAAGAVQLGDRRSDHDLAAVGAEVAVVARQQPLGRGGQRAQPGAEAGLALGVGHGRTPSG